MTTKSGTDSLFLSGGAALPIPLDVTDRIAVNAAADSSSTTCLRGLFPMGACNPDRYLSRSCTNDEEQSLIERPRDGCETHPGEDAKRCRDALVGCCNPQGAKSSFERTSHTESLGRGSARLAPAAISANPDRRRAQSLFVVIRGRG